MFEELLEDIAQKNGLSEVNTYLKLTAGLGAIFLCLISPAYIAPIFITVLLSCAIIFLARIDFRTYAKLFTVSFWFAFLSVVGLILTYGGSTVFWSWDPMPWLMLSITRESVNQGTLVFCRVIGGTSALCFIALTTPMTDLFIVLRKCCIPEAVIDLMMIIYRTIFILMDQVTQIYNAQVMRLGYSSMRESVQSCATLCGAAFIASWNSGEDLIRAMDARCYNGRFAVIGENRPIECKPLLTLIIFLVASSVIILFSRNITLL
jgi:cobalt/nickel transport system permease protein